MKYELDICSNHCLLADMMTPGSDFTKVNSKRYKVWRILRTHYQLIDLYKRRMTALSGYRTAIIFPEQLLNLNQSHIYRVVSQKHSEQVQASILVMSKFELDHVSKPVTTAQEILEAEASGLIIIRSSNVGAKNFTDNVLFTSKTDALKYASKLMEKLLNSIA